jgi:hypothetical protein
MLCLTSVTCSGCSNKFFDVVQGTLDFDVAHEPEPATFGNVVNALWALPVDLGNELLDDPPEGVPNDVFLEDEDEQFVDDDDEESVDLLAETPVPAPMKLTTKRAWSYQYKLRAVIDTFYVLKSEVAGQRKYKVPAYQLRRWQERIEQLDIDRVDFAVGRDFTAGLERKVLAKKKIGCGRSGEHLEAVHKELSAWYDARKPTGAILNRSVLARKLFDLMNPRCVPSTEDLANYVFRVDRWRKQRDVVRRRVTHKAQKVRIVKCLTMHILVTHTSLATTMYRQVEKDQQVLDDWVNMVNETIKTYNIRPDCIVSFDETNCYFDQAKKIGYQLCDRGSKEVNLQTAGNSSRCTIGVGVTGTGDMLTPSVIWCGVNRSTGEVWKEIRKDDNGYPDDDMHYMVQEKGWMDEVGMLEWICTTWTSFVYLKGGPTMPTYLLMDTVLMHKTEKVRHALASLGTIVDFVPPIVRQSCRCAMCLLTLRFKLPSVGSM